MWELDEAGHAGRVDTAERVARDRDAGQPHWIIDMPRLYVTDATRRWMREVVQNGSYDVYASDGQSALLRRAAAPAARRDKGGTER
jgi:hypothetical protein